MALTNNWFDNKWSWGDKGDKPVIPPRKRSDNDLPQLVPADTVSVANLDQTPAPKGNVDNCLSDVCNYIGDSYAEYVTGATVETLVDLFGVLSFKSKGGCTLTLVLSFKINFSDSIANITKLSEWLSILVVSVLATVNRSFYQTLRALDFLGTCHCHITVMVVLKHACVLVGSLLGRCKIRANLGLEYGVNSIYLARQVV